jgi:hypothetical protein
VPRRLPRALLVFDTWGITQMRTRHFAPCLVADSQTVHVVADRAVTSPIKLRAAATPGVTATVTPDTVYPGFGSMDVTVTADSGNAANVSDGNVLIFAHADGWTDTYGSVPVRFSASNATVDTVGHDRLHNPSVYGFRQQQPTEIYLTGGGWCGSLSVSFGGSAFVPAKLVKPGFAELSLPLGANSGDVTAKTGTGATFKAGTLQVDRYRTIDGFPFVNPATDAEMVKADLQHLFGKENTDIQWDPCSEATLGFGPSCGLVDINELTPIMAGMLGSWNEGVKPGNCFGVSVENLRMLTGEDSPKTYGAPRNDPMAIPTNGALPRDDLYQTIHYWQISQISQQVQLPTAARRRASRTSRTGSRTASTATSRSSSE